MMRMAEEDHSRRELRKKEKNSNQVVRDLRAWVEARLPLTLPGHLPAARRSTDLPAHKWAASVRGRCETSRRRNRSRSTGWSESRRPPAGDARRFPSAPAPRRGDGLDLRFRLRRADHEIIGDGGNIAQIENDRVERLFFLRRPDRLPGQVETAQLGRNRGGMGLGRGSLGKIKSVTLDISRDRSGDQMIDRQTGFHAVTNFSGRYIDSAGLRQAQNALRQTAAGGFPPWQERKSDETAQLIGPVPFRKTLQLVGANQPKKLGPWKGFPNFQRGIVGVGRWRPVELTARQPETGLALQAQRSMVARWASVACALCALNGDRLAGTKRMASSRSCSIASRAKSRWP